MGLQVLRAVLLNGATLLLICSTFFTACVTDSPKQVAEVKTLPYYHTPDFTPIWEASKQMLDTLHTVAPFSFVDQEGNVVTNKTFEGKIYVADFFFTGCAGICPVITRNMKTVADSFAHNDMIAFISHSVTPYADSIPVLKAFADDYGVNEQQWKMITGNKADIYTLARQSYFAEDEIGFNSDSTQFLHTERFVLVDKNGHLRGVYNGTVALEMDRLIEDINILLVE